MTGFALALVLAAATIHASFNLMAKRAVAIDSTTFVIEYSTGSAG